MGFIVVWQLGDVWEVIDLATELCWRRQGVASSLLATVTREAAGFGIRAVLLEVRAGNHAALALYEKHGFCVLSERKDYYRAPVENALCLRLTLPAPPLGTA
jgi:ribosomal-protein-alanine N-acetyltransferase